MKKYCYVVVGSNGFSLSLRDLADTKDQWNQLPMMLEDGWTPLREIPMGSGPNGAWCLILLEKEREKNEST